MTFTSPLPATDPLPIAPERAMLASWLDAFRADLLSKLNGLTEGQADQRLLPSLTTLHGLVRHLTKVEHVWFVQVLAGLTEAAPYGWPEKRTGDFELTGSAGLDADVASFVAAIERSRQIAAGQSLDDVRHHHRLGDVSVRWVLQHVISEYAQHCGHADIVRELIDGTTMS